MAIGPFCSERCSTDPSWYPLQHNVLEHPGNISKSVEPRFAWRDGLPFILVLAGLGSAFYLYMMRPDLPELIQQKFAVPLRHHGAQVSVRRNLPGGVHARQSGLGTVRCGNSATRGLIDGLMGERHGTTGGLVRRRHPACADRLSITMRFAMIVSLLVLLTWFVTANLEEENHAVGTALLSLVIWFPILGGVAVLFVGDENPGRARRWR